MNIIKNQVIPIIPSKTYIAIDSEWHNLNSATIHRPTSGEFACLTACIDGENVYFIQDKEKIIQTFKNIQNATLLIHEAKFDLIQLMRFIPKNILCHPAILDTLMMEKILFSGYYNSFGLNDIVRRYLDVSLEKELQKSFKGETLTQEQVEYACQDAMYLRQAWDEQRKNITKESVYIYKSVDRPTMFAVMDFMGFCINVDGWRKLAIANRKKQEELDASLHIPYTPRQFAKLKEWLSQHGFPKIDSTNEATLQKFLAKYPDTEAGHATQIILDSRMYGKRASTYGTDWIDEHLEHDNEGNAFVFANWNINGTETGRFSCDSPNLQNVPIRETKEYRKLFIPRKGNVLVVGDFSQQEPGVLAYLTQDKKLISMFNTGEDFYVLAAKELLHKNITHSDPLRKKMKDLVLGTDYGLSEYGLARRWNIDKEEAAEHINRLFKTFPGIREYQRRQEKETKFVTSILGRRIWLNPYTYQCRNNALNAPVQSSAAEMLKIVVVDLHKNWNLSCPFGVVAVVHDEIILDVPKECAKDAHKLLKETMESMAAWLCPGLKFKADVHICSNSWAEKELQEE